MCCLKSNENKHILSEYPLIEKYSDNAYMSKIGTKKYVIKYLKSNNHEIDKEISIIKYLTGTIFNKSHENFANIKSTKVIKKTFCENFFTIGCCSSDDAMNDINENELLIKDTNDQFNLKYMYRYVTMIERNNMKYLISEYSGDDMFNFISNNDHCFTEQTMKNIFYQLVHAVKELHSLGIIHGDMSLENVCVLEKDGTFEIKLIDIAFGMIHPASPHYEVYKEYEEYDKVQIINTKNIDVFLTSIRKNTINNDDSYVGKTHYMSPERFLAHTQNTLYCSYKDDIYALGIILHSLVFGRFPYKKPSEYDENFRTLMSGKWKKNINEEYYILNHIEHRKQIEHQSVIDLIDRILKCESKRMEISDILNHPWLPNKIDIIND